MQEAFRNYQDFLLRHIYIKAGELKSRIIIHTAVALHPALRFDSNNVPEEIGYCAWNVRQVLAKNIKRLQFLPGFLRSSESFLKAKLQATHFDQPVFPVSRSGLNQSR